MTMRPFVWWRKPKVTISGSPPMPAKPQIPIDNRDILIRLDEIANLKVGDPFPAEWPPNNWGPAMSALLRTAASEIRYLRGQLESIEEDLPKTPALPVNNIRSIDPDWPERTIVSGVFGGIELDSPTPGLTRTIDNKTDGDIVIHGAALPLLRLKKGWRAYFAAFDRSWTLTAIELIKTHGPVPWRPEP
jgi:hypothetical protein